MAQFKQITTLFHLLIITISAQAEDPDTKTQAEIQALEKQKGELFKQINDAIDESVKTLAQNNDTDSKLGINLIKNLKIQLKELNGTDLASNNFKTLNDTRRRAKKDSKKMGRRAVVQRSHADDKLFVDELKNKAMFSQKHKDRLESRILMQERVQEWLLKKRKAKLKLKELSFNKTSEHALVEAKEKCPVFGVDGGGKKKGKGKSKFKGLYGCCRKCCKKSYMGCLKKK